MSLFEQISSLTKKLELGTFVSESQVSQGVVLPLLHALGWPVFDTGVVTPQYKVKSRYVDFALCHPTSKPLILVEVKKRGNLQGADEQLFQYAFMVGIPLAVLTDGVEWHFYTPPGQGEMEERRFYLLDLVERPLAESAFRLERYLAYSSCCNGEALKAAQADYSSVQNEKLVLTSIPTAWGKLLSEPDDLLVDLLFEKTESLTGFKPDREQVAEFVREAQKGNQQKFEVPKTSTSIPAPAPYYVPPSEPKECGYFLHGIWQGGKNAIEVFMAILDDLAKTDPTFLPKLASATTSKSRRLLSQNKHELYIKKPELNEKASKRLDAGWWVGTNISNALKFQYLQKACQIAGLKFDSDLKVQF